MHDDPTEDFGNVVIVAGGSLRVANGFWSIFCTEVDSIFQAVADVADTPEEQPATSDHGSNVTGSIRSHHQYFAMGDALATRIHDDTDLSLSPLEILFL